MKPPFPWPGGKSRWAEEVWSRFGTPAGYYEPFFGSGAVLLHRSQPCRREVVCDVNGYVVNFYRAVRSDPDAVAVHADWPTYSDDYDARRKHLLGWDGSRLGDDPEWCDAKAAGWWLWGVSNSIQPGIFPDPYRRRPYSKSNPGGCGCSAQRSFGERHDADLDGSRLLPLMRALAVRLARVVVLNRSWRACTSDTILMQKASGVLQDVAVFLDPPYRGVDLYTHHGDSPAIEAWEWACENGGRLKIAYCMHEGDFSAPDGWEVLTRPFKSQHRSRGRDDCIVFSPACSAPRRLW